MAVLTTVFSVDKTADICISMDNVHRTADAIELPGFRPWQFYGLFRLSEQFCSPSHFCNFFHKAADLGSSMDTFG